MQDITLENDDYTFRIEVPNKGHLILDGFEVAALAEELTDAAPAEQPPTTTQIGAAVRDIVRCEPEEMSLDDITDRQLFSAARKVLAKIETLKNE